MQFTPKSQEEIDAEGLIPEGIYPFTVLSADEKSDRNSKPFFNLKVNVFNDERGSWVYDNISPAWFAFKLRHFCEMAGLMKQYESGSLEAEDIVGCEGYCKVVRKPAAKGYAAKNEIADYIKPEEKDAANTTKRVMTEDHEADDIPFDL